MLTLTFGPSESCQTCVWYTHVQKKANVYRKCGRDRKTWPGGPATNIRAKDPACEFWEEGLKDAGMTLYVIP